MAIVEAIVNGDEADTIDPVESVSVRNGAICIFNGQHHYELPIGAKVELRLRNTKDTSHD